MSGSRSKKIRRVFLGSLTEQYVICFNAMCGERFGRRFKLAVRILKGRKIVIKAPVRKMLKSIAQGVGKK